MYARIIDNVAVDVAADPSTAFHPLLAAEFDEVPAEVRAGWRLVDDVWLAPEPVAEPEPVLVDLAALKADLTAQIDSAAEAERARYITPGSGQAMTYLAKAGEAERLAQDADPDPANYPLLSAEIGITGDTLADVGAVVLTAYTQWQQIGGAIERARLAGKAAVMAAVDEAGARAAAQVVWPGS
ncbi:hypothetical protein [Pararhodobacter sp.]|uniref:hypothetical protein n=1 Tax=Pararhodobacter sp. TaxID=2127056 RepID=UPI002AFE0DD0|nr:hypothetical protein [Pararhodobacter sp.]